MATEMSNVQMVLGFYLFEDNVYPLHRENRTFLTYQDMVFHTQRAYMLVTVPYMELQLMVDAHSPALASLTPRYGKLRNIKYLLPP